MKHMKGSIVVYRGIPYVQIIRHAIETACVAGWCGNGWCMVWVTVETEHGEVADLFVALAPCPLPRHRCFCCRQWWWLCHNHQMLWQVCGIIFVMAGVQVMGAGWGFVSGNEVWGGVVTFWWPSLLAHFPGIVVCCCCWGWCYWCVLGWLCAVEQWLQVVALSGDDDTVNDDRGKQLLCW